jgi:DNA-binding MarR family transcriptional regulator
LLDTTSLPCENSETELSTMTEIKQHEYDLLNEIGKDPMVTQANLSKRLGIAVGSVNWYVKRLIHRGWVKVSHLDRTRLKYDLTKEGMAVFTQRAVSYARNSLKVYSEFRNKARDVVRELREMNIHQVNVEGTDEVMDILRLTCIEEGIHITEDVTGVLLTAEGQEYKVMYE